MKSYLKSRTFWFNLLVALSGVATMFADHIATGGVITTLSMFNILLRFLTKEGIKFK